MFTEGLLPDSSNESRDSDGTTRPLSERGGTGNQAIGGRHEAMLEFDQSVQGIGSAERRDPCDLTELQSLPIRFDEKYKRNGRYATSIPEKFDGPGPALTLRRTDREIPKIGALLAGSDDSSEPTEDVADGDQSM